MFQKVKDLHFKASMKVMGMLGILSGILYGQKPVAAFANNDFSWLTDPTKGNDTFDDLTNTVKQTGNSLYQLVLAGSIVGLLIAIVLVGFAFFMTKNATKKDESKSHLLWVVIGGAIVFGAPSIIGLIYSIGQGF